jgi:hypothetical protein
MAIAVGAQAMPQVPCTARAFNPAPAWCYKYEAAARSRPR